MALNDDPNSFGTSAPSGVVDDTEINLMMERLHESAKVILSLMLPSVRVCNLILLPTVNRKSVVETTVDLELAATLREDFDPLTSR